MTTDIKNATPKDRTELLHGIFTRLFNALLNFEFKHGTFLIAIVAWLLTAQSAQTLIASSILIRVSFSLLMVMLTSFHAVWVFRFYSHSAAVYAKLEETRYMPTCYFDHERVTKLLVISFSLIHFGGTILVLVMLWSIASHA